MWHRKQQLIVIGSNIYCNCIQSSYSHTVCYIMLHTYNILFLKNLLFAFSSLKQIYGQFPVAASTTYFPHTLPGSRVKILRQWCLLTPGGPGCAGCNERTCRAGYGSPAPWYHAKELLGNGITPYFWWEHQGRKKHRSSPGQVRVSRYETLHLLSTLCAHSKHYAGWNMRQKI